MSLHYLIRNSFSSSSSSSDELYACLDDLQYGAFETCFQESRKCWADAEDNATISQLNYNMPFNNLAPSFESNRNLSGAFSLCFSFGFLRFRLIEVENENEN